MATIEARTTPVDDRADRPIGEWLRSALSTPDRSSHGIVKRLAPNEHLFFEGETRRSLYVVESGVVGLYKLTRTGRRQICRFLFADDVVGLAGSRRHSSGAEALCAVQVRAVANEKVERLMREDSAFALALLRETSRELDETRDRMLKLGRQCALEKVAAFLSDLSYRNERLGRTPDRLHLPMKRCDIADYLGLTIETVSRNFTTLRHAGVLVTHPGGMIDIVDRHALTSIADAECPVAA